MKSKKEFLNEFCDRLTESGFVVEAADEIDIAAEVYQDDTLFCYITQFGDIIYEIYDEGKARELELLVKEIQNSLNVCITSPFEEIEQGETISLT